MWHTPPYGPGSLESALGVLRANFGALAWAAILLLALPHAPALLAGLLPDRRCRR